MCRSWKSWDKDVFIPFTNMDKWINFSVEGCWFELQFQEVYSVPEAHRNILGSTDSRIVFSLGFLLPFVKAEGG
jgi:hypothetical protein